jgi:hypothetical protein
MRGPSPARTAECYRGPRAPAPVRRARAASSVLRPIIAGEAGLKGLSKPIAQEGENMPFAQKSKKFQAANFFGIAGRD